MLLLCDAGICCSQVLFTARSIGAHVVGRLDRCSYTVPWVRLQDGSYLVKVYQNSRNRGGKVLTARVIEYQLKDPRTGELSSPVRLITTLLDPKLSPIEALIRLYHERWAIEQAIDEIKTHLCLSARTLRSQTPQVVEQELYGLLLAYFAVRTLMYMAARHSDWDPDEVSFVHTINVHKPQPVAFDAGYALPTSHTASSPLARSVPGARPASSGALPSSRRQAHPFAL